MKRMGGNASKGLARRSFGSAGGGNAPVRLGKVIDPEEEILRGPLVPPAPRTWKPRAGRIYNFPVLRIVDEK